MCLDLPTTIFMKPALTHAAIISRMEIGVANRTATVPGLTIPIMAAIFSFLLRIAQFEVCPGLPLVGVVTLWMERDMSSDGTIGKMPTIPIMELNQLLYEEPVIECFTITDLISIMARRARSSADNAAASRSFTTMRQQELAPQRIR